jgi:hypothetical protein
MIKTFSASPVGLENGQGFLKSTVSVVCLHLPYSNVQEAYTPLRT